VCTGPTVGDCVTAVDDDFRVLNPTASGATVALITPLENDSLVDPGNTQIVSVTQPTAFWGTNEQNYKEYQIGEVRIAPDGQRLIWDLNPPEDTVTQNGLPLLGYPLGSAGFGFPGRLLPKPMPVVYTIEQGTHESSATLVLYVSTPDQIPFPFNPDASGILVPIPDGAASSGTPGFVVPFGVPLQVTERKAVFPASGTATFTLTGPAPVCIPSDTRTCTGATSFRADVDVHLPSNAPELQSNFSVDTAQFRLVDPLEVTGLTELNPTTGFRSVQMAGITVVPTNLRLPHVTVVGQVGSLQNVICLSQDVVVPCPSSTTGVPCDLTNHILPGCGPWGGDAGPILTLLSNYHLGARWACVVNPICDRYLFPNACTIVPYGTIVNITVTRPTCN
jgi:hypothetical protein